MLVSSQVAALLGMADYPRDTHLDRAARMTSVGAVVLLLGCALVGGAVYVKTHRHEIHRLPTCVPVLLAPL